MMKIMRWTLLAMLLCACALPPAPPPASTHSQAMQKINPILMTVDENGMVGSGTSKRTVAYEFCIPREEAKKAEVLAIDPSIQFYTSPGRIGCTGEEYLCIGEGGTRETLIELAQLDYIDRIEPFYGE